MKTLTLQTFLVIAAITAMASLTYAKDTTRLADAHSDACDYNYSECMNGCGGASGCEGQCQTNYEGCMSQGQ